MKAILHLTDDDKRDILGLFADYLEGLKERPQSKLGLINAAEVVEELGISVSTLNRWEIIGLKRYQPPVGASKIRLYRITDILQFLGVEDE